MRTRAAQVGLVFWAVALQAAVVRAETGYDLWLRYAAVEDAGLRDAYRRSVAALVIPESSPTARITPEKLPEYLKLPFVLACGGSWLAPREALAKGDFATIRKRVEEAARLLAGVAAK